MLLEHPRLGAVSLDEFGEIRNAWELTIKLEILKVGVLHLTSYILHPVTGPATILTTWQENVVGCELYFPSYFREAINPALKLTENTAGCARFS